MTVKKHRTRNNESTLDMDISKPKFPSARYFQVHFQHMESQLDSTQRRLEALQLQVAELQENIGSQQDGFDLSKAKK